MGNVKSVRCIIPFTSLQILPNGHCLSCCPTWTTTGYIGQIKASDSLSDVWNSPKIQFIRNAIYDNQLEKVCSFKYCPIAISQYNYDLDSIQIRDQNFGNIIEQIKERKTVLNTPPWDVNLALSGACNIRCVMCESHQEYTNVDHDLEKAVYDRIIPENLSSLSRLVLTGNGDPLYNNLSRSFLQNLKSEKYPSLKISLITNGLLFTPRLWEKIKHLNFDYINISIDATKKETYEYIRKRGKWEVLYKNLQFISELRKEGFFTFLTISFVVMKSNYKELKSFVEMGKKFGCDRVLFQKNFHLVSLKENINFTNDKRIFIKIAKILQDPIFSDPIVDSTLINEYKQYQSIKVNVIDILKTEIKRRLFYFPLKIKYLQRKKWVKIQQKHRFLENTKASKLK